MTFRPCFETERFRAFVEVPVRAMISGQRPPKIVWALRILFAIVLLRLVAVARKVVVGNRWRDFARDDCPDRRTANVILAAARMVCSIIDGPGCDFRLEDRR